MADEYQIRDAVALIGDQAGVDPDEFANILESIARDLARATDDGDEPEIRQPAGTCDDCGTGRATIDWDEGLVCASCGSPWPMMGGSR